MGFSGDKTCAVGVDSDFMCAIYFGRDHTCAVDVSRDYACAMGLVGDSIRQRSQNTAQKKRTKFKNETRSSEILVPCFELTRSSQGV